MSAAKNYRNRIYLKNSLNNDSVIELGEYHFNYLIKVLRLKVGNYIRVFNETYGQWLAEIQSVGKKGVTIKICEFLLASPSHTSKLTLIFAPIKNPGTGFYVQKATELGADIIIPVLTKRTVVRTLKHEKLEQIAIEATEQCERFSVPQINPMIDTGYIETLKVGKIFFCDEAEKSLSICDTIKQQKTSSDVILIGPEGGFDKEERAYLRSLPNTVPISLGINILRAETAMIVALGLYSACAQ